MEEEKKPSLSVLANNPSIPLFLRRGQSKHRSLESRRRRNGQADCFLPPGGGQIRPPPPLLSPPTSTVKPLHSSMLSKQWLSQYRDFTVLFGPRASMNGQMNITALKEQGDDGERLQILSPILLGNLGWLTSTVFSPLSFRETKLKINLGREETRAEKEIRAFFFCLASFVGSSSSFLTKSLPPPPLFPPMTARVFFCPPPPFPNAVNLEC